MTKQSVSFDELGDRMKHYENLGVSGMRLLPMIPIVARIDGRSFHNFTKGMKRPFDEEFSNAMTHALIHLVKHTGASIGYTQSDEISLVWCQDSFKSEVWFDGRVAKMTSQLAAQATLAFYREVVKTMPPEFAERLPTFDVRIWNVPTKDEAVNALIWRELDATKNSVSMAAHHYFSHKFLQGKNTSTKRELLLSEKGIRWEDYPTHFKRGTYVQRVKKLTKFSADEIERLPKKHEARSNPDLMIERSVVEVVELPPLTKISNRVEVVFEGQQPILFSESL